MSDSNVESIASEIHELERLLRTVKREAKNFLEEEGIESKSSKRQRKNVTPPRSTWARSRVPQGYSVGPRLSSAQSLESREVLEAEKNLHTRSPAYTIGSRPKSSKKQAVMDEIIASEPNPMTYNVKDDLLSTKARKTKGLKFSSSKRDNLQFSQSTHSPTSNSLPNEDSDVYEIIEYEEVIPTGFSFGKSERFREKDENCTKISELDRQSNDLDLQRADKALRPNTPSIIYAKPRDVSESRTASSPKSKYVDAPSTPLKVNIDVTSYRPRTVATKIHSETTISEKVRTAKAMTGVAPGPGYYNVSNDALKLVEKGSGLTAGPKIAPLTRSESRGQTRKALETADLGPGHYDTETPRHIRGVKYRPVAEEKEESKHLKLKRYFEQKAQDARDFHDHQNYANDTVIRSRTPTVSFGRGRSAETTTNRKRSSYSLSPNDKEEKIRLAKIDQQGSAMTPSQLTYNVKYSVVEPKSGSAVSWKAEMQARQSTQERLSKKSQVQSVLADKEEGDPAKRRFYGPSLPIAWVPDKPSLSKRLSRKEKSMGDQSDDDYDRERSKSPTAEVLRLLSSRNGQDDPADIDPLTQAYLQSSFAGAMHKKPAVVHMQVTGNDQDAGYIRKLSPEEQAFDFLGPQLQPDWATNDATTSILSKRSKPVTVALDKTKGRERVKIHGKGMVEIEDFGSHRIHKDEDRVGPGEYDVLSHIEISKAKAKGGIVQFDKIVAREDMIGPRGEKPISAQQAEIELQEDEELGIERLDIDYAAAKDAYQTKNKGKNIVLYAKDRYPEEKKKPDDLARLDHLGGSWFEGMYDTMQKAKSKVVDFDRMKGRSMMEATEEQELDDELHAELGVAREGEALDLVITDPHPHKVDADGKVMVFADVKKHPRFQTDRATKELQARYAAQTELNVRDDLLHERRDVTLVDMGKTPGRVNTLDAKEEDAQVDAWVHGDIDHDAALKLGEEQAQQIAQGQHALKKRVKQTVDMSKQRGRQEVTNDGDVHNQRLQENLETAVVAEDAGEYGQYFAEAEEKVYPSGLNQKGLVAWNKQSSQRDPNQAKQQEQAVVRTVAELGHGEEELDLAPSKQATSGHKRTKGGLEWQKQRDDNHMSGSETAHKIVSENIPLDSLLDPLEIVGGKNGTVLELADVDPGDLKGGGFTSLAHQKTRGKAVNSTNMNNVPGRQDLAQGQAAVRDAMEKEFGQEILTGVAAAGVTGDIVQINPSDGPTLPKAKQSTAMRSNVARFPDHASTVEKTKGGIQSNQREKHLLGAEVDEYDVAPRNAGRASTERLDLDVRDEAVRTSRVKALPTMASRSERLQARPAVTNDAFHQLELRQSNAVNDPAAVGAVSADELQLDVKDDMLRREVGAANTGASSLRNSAARFAIAQGGQDERQVLKETIGEPDELKLQPQDAMTRNRVANTGAALSKAATGRGITKPNGTQQSKEQLKRPPSSTNTTVAAATGSRRGSTSSSTAGAIPSTKGGSKTPAVSSAITTKKDTKLSGTNVERSKSATSRISRTSNATNKAKTSVPPPTISPIAVTAPTPARPPSKEFFSLEEEMKKLRL